MDTDWCLRCGTHIEGPSVSGTATTAYCSRDCRSHDLSLVDYGLHSSPSQSEYEFPSSSYPHHPAFNRDPMEVNPPSKDIMGWAQSIADAGPPPPAAPLQSTSASGSGASTSASASCSSAASPTILPRAVQIIKATVPGRPSPDTVLAVGGSRSRPKTLLSMRRSGAAKLFMPSHAKPAPPSASDSIAIHASRSVSTLADSLVAPSLVHSEKEKRTSTPTATVGLFGVLKALIAPVTRHSPPRSKPGPPAPRSSPTPTSRRRRSGLTSAVTSASEDDDDDLALYAVPLSLPNIIIADPGYLATASDDEGAVSPFIGDRTDPMWISPPASASRRRKEWEAAGCHDYSALRDYECHRAGRMRHRIARHNKKVEDLLEPVHQDSSSIGRMEYEPDHPIYLSRGRKTTKD